MSTFKFMPEMFHAFYSDNISFCSAAQAAEKANEILSKHLASLPVVYGELMRGDSFWSQSQNADERCDDTHKAVLFNCESIEKTPCKHEPELGNAHKGYELYCKHCAKKLKPAGGWTAE